jgi:RNA polymerase sigma factor (sigma-70 family)
VCDEAALLPRHERPRDALPHLTSLDEQAGDNDGVTYGDVVAADAGLDPAVHHAGTEERTGLVEALGALSERARRVVELRFGLDGSEPRSLAQVAAELGLSRERVRRIEAQALLRLRTLPELSRLRMAA